MGRFSIAKYRLIKSKKKQRESILFIPHENIMNGVLSYAQHLSALQ